MLFSVGGEYYHAQPSIEYEYVVDRIFENARNVSIRLHGGAAKFVKLQLFFSLRWILISEVAFDSGKARVHTNTDVFVSVAFTTQTLVVPDMNISQGLFPHPFRAHNLLRVFCPF